VIALELIGVRVEVPANTPMMLLKEQEGDRRLLPIYIGTPEASAIHYALDGVEPPRPLTHDLFLVTLGELGASIDKVVITEMKERTFHAEVHLSSAAGAKIISSRPSDAVALAVRCNAPLFATDELMAAEAHEAPAEAEDDAAEIIDDFKDFLDNVSPEDFEA